MTETSKQLVVNVSNIFRRDHSSLHRFYRCVQRI